MILLITSLLVIAIVLLVVGRRRFGGWLMVVCLVVLVIAGTEFTPRIMLEALGAPFTEQPPPEWAASNAIILLGAGSIKIGKSVYPPAMAYGRTTKAAEAYRSCRVGPKLCIIVVSGGDPREQGIAEADLYAATLMKLGVRKSDIIVENKSRNTFENARFTARIVSEKGFDRYYLVTSGFHMRRSLLFFNHFGLDARPLPAFMAMPDKSWLPIAHNVLLTDVALYEYVGLLQYDIYNMMGWNPPPVQQKTGS